jgi:hypothetical protein
MKFIVRWTRELECVVEADSSEDIVEAWEATPPSCIDDWNPEDWEMETPVPTTTRHRPGMGVSGEQFLNHDDYLMEKENP